MSPKANLHDFSNDNFVIDHGISYFFFISYFFRIFFMSASFSETIFSKIILLKRLLRFMLKGIQPNTYIVYNLNALFKIKNLEIKEGRIPIFVAEISGNHNQKFSTALKLIKAAKDSGADAVKFQFYDENDMTLNSKNEEFLIKDKKVHGLENIFLIFIKSHLHQKTWFKKLFQYSNKIGLPCFTSVFNHEAVDFLERIGNPAYKISSFEINHIPLIDRVSRTGKPVILSTGVANDFEISQAVKICKKNKNNKIILLKCSSEYPAKLSRV